MKSWSLKTVAAFWRYSYMSIQKFKNVKIQTSELSKCLVWYKLERSNRKDETMRNWCRVVSGMDCQGRKFTLAVKCDSCPKFSVYLAIKIVNMCQHLFLPVLLRVYKITVSEVCFCPGFESVYAYHWLMVLITQGQLSEQ